jgi:hypothetical protein
MGAGGNTPFRFFVASPGPLWVAKESMDEHNATLVAIQSRSTSEKRDETYIATAALASLGIYT